MSLLTSQTLQPVLFHFMSIRVQETWNSGLIYLFILQLKIGPIFEGWVFKLGVFS